MRRTVLAGLALLAASSLGSAQLAGSYTISATGGSYASFKAATVDLYLQGVSGPVRFLVLPGIYKESFFWFPATGASATNDIQVHNPIGRGVKVEGAGSDIVTILGSAGQPASWVTWDGIEFDNAPGAAFFANQQVAQEWEFKNCVFGPNFAKSGGSYVATFYMNSGSNKTNDWEIHHCKFTLPQSSSSYDGSLLYCQGIYRWDIHTNEIDLNGCRNAFSTWNANSSNMRIRNNVFYGALFDAKDSAIVRATWSHYDIEIAHNTFFVDTGATCSRIFELGGCCTTRKSLFYSNIVYWTGNAAAIESKTTVHQYFMGDGNIYWNPAFNPTNLPVAWDTSITYTLAAWQTAINGEAASKVIDPILVRPIFPYLPGSLNVRPNSPAKDAGVEFAGYATFPADPVTTDFQGRFRDDKPDIGAYELSGFAVFGDGCTGTGSAIPAMGYQGTVAIPSTNFAVGISNGLGGAPAILFLGLSRTNFGPLPLPLALGGGCNLLTDITATFGVALMGSGSGAGTASLFIPIPNNVALNGTNLFFQWAVIDSLGASPLGIAMSNGGALQL